MKLTILGLIFLFANSALASDCNLTEERGYVLIEVDTISDSPTDAFSVGEHKIVREAGAYRVTLTTLGSGNSASPPKLEILHIPSGFSAKAGSFNYAPSVEISGDGFSATLACK